MKNLLFCFLFLAAIYPVYTQENRTILEVDYRQENGKLDPIWAWFGYDEPNYTYMKDGKKLLSELAALSHVPVYVRTHNLLTSGDGKADLKWGSTNVYTEDKKGTPVYNWTILDSIVDTYVNLGMKPLMEIGFMPEALSTKPKPYKHSWVSGGELWTGWAYPPKNYKKWEELVYQWVKHSIERYGVEEVKSWYWELWNEPNIGYWQGTFDEFCKLYDYSARAVKRACPDCMMGGPHTTNPDSPAAEKFLRDFLAHCDTGKNYATGKTGSPLDFIAFHAKGNPTLMNGHIRMDMSPQLKAIETGFKVVTSFEKFKNLPVIVGECDPEGCAACSKEREPRYAYRNGTVYPSYTAASYARIYDLVQQYSINFKGAVTWAFEFENQPWFAGFRDLATNGVDKPVLNVFRMFGMMPETRLVVKSSSGLGAEDIISSGVRGNNPDINGLAGRNERSLAVMVWNYHDDDIPANASEIELILKNLPTDQVLVHHYRVDGLHSNSYETWKKMGFPQNVTQEQYGALERSGQLELLTSPEYKRIADSTTSMQFSLPRQGVSLIKLEW